MSLISRKDLVCSDFDAIIVDIRELCIASLIVRASALMLERQTLWLMSCACQDLFNCQEKQLLGLYLHVVMMYCWTICVIMFNVGDEYNCFQKKKEGVI